MGRSNSSVRAISSRSTSSNSDEIYECEETKTLDKSISKTNKQINGTVKHLETCQKRSIKDMSRVELKDEVSLIDREFRRYRCDTMQELLSYQNDMKQAVAALKQVRSENKALSRQVRRSQKYCTSAKAVIDDVFGWKNSLSSKNYKLHGENLRLIPKNKQISEELSKLRQK